MIKKIAENFVPRKYFAEMLLVFLALFGAYLIIAWSSYSPLDSSWAVSNSQAEVINKAGALGAWLVDLFFVFFGKVGHIFPFVLCFAPIYLLASKLVNRLTWQRIALRTFGFALFLCGLCALFALLLANDNAHLAGGVLGGSLLKNFFPMLGKFGVVLGGVALTVLGFILCSGASLLQLVAKFYQWLTFKNEQSATTETNDETAFNTTKTTENLTADIEPNVSEALVDEQIVTNNISTPINIFGLTPISDETPPSELFAQDRPFSQDNDYGGYGEDETLPTVHIDTPQNMAENLTAGGLDTQDWNGISINLNHSSSPNFVKTADQNLDDFTKTQDKLEFNDGSSLDEQDDEMMPSISLPNRFAPIDNSIVPSNIPSKLGTPKPLEPVENIGEVVSVHNPIQQSQSEFVAMPIVAEKVVESEPTEEWDNQTTSDGRRVVNINELVDLFADKKVEKPTTELPSLSLLEQRPNESQAITEDYLRSTSHRIEQQLRNFKINASVKDVLVGPVVTRYELELQAGVKASRVTSVDTDLARALMFRAIRVTETIPDKPYIGIETPNKHRQKVWLRDVLDSDEFRQSKALLPLALGKDISGKAVVIDLAKCPHLLVAGATGSGKSVGLNTMILSLLFRVKPNEVKFIMIDPKQVELSVYNGIPHLLTEVVTDMKKAANALRWCVDEMERRYQLLSSFQVRNIEGFNEKIDFYNKQGVAIPDPLWKPGDSMDNSPPILEKLSYIVLIVDEFAELMIVVGKQIEELIARLTQKARAIGIHVILATQRPSVDVITGLIKSNIPSRIAFTVAQRNDSRTILDQNGAEALLGMGDMLYLGNGTQNLLRVHGAYMSDDEVINVAADWRARAKPNYISAILDNPADEGDSNENNEGASSELDALFDKAVDIVINGGNISANRLQIMLGIGFPRASRLIHQLSEQGIITKRNGKLVLQDSTEY